MKKKLRYPYSLSSTHSKTSTLYTTVQMHPTRKKNEAGGAGAQLSRREESLKNAALLPRTRAQCARTIYSNLVFLLSHLSHMQQNVRKQSRESHQTNSLKRRDAMMPFDCSVLKHTNHKHNLLISSYF